MEFDLEMSQDVASVFGMIDGIVYHVEKEPIKIITEDKEKDNKIIEESLPKSAQEKSYEIVVENNEAVGGMQQFELILPNDDLNFTSVLGDNTYIATSSVFNVSIFEMKIIILHLNYKEIT